LFERCRALLDSWTLDAPVIAVRVAIAAAAPLTGEQGDLLSASWRDLGAADAAFERLRAELGAGAIVRAQAQDSHRPEKAGVWKELSDGLTVGRSDGQTTSPDQPPRTPAVRPSDRETVRLVASPPVSRAASARRALDPPETVDVVCDGETPCVVTWRGQRIPITRALGPERLSGDWWDDGYRRDYWRCESVAGDLTVYWDRSDDSWRLQSWRD
jgi:protein ImuB